jgi:hypothetical protein
LSQKRAEMPGDPDEVIEELVQEIWTEIGMENN